MADSLFVNIMDGGGGMSENNNHLFLRELFLKGHYDQCLDKLRNLENNSNNYLINENNKFVCESLSNSTSLECQEKCVEALIKLYDNCYAWHSHKINPCPMHVQLTILWNSQWLALTLVSVKPYNHSLCDRLLSRIIKCCVQAEIIYFDDNFEGGSWIKCLKSFLETINKLSEINIKNTAILMETVLAVILTRSRDISNEEIVEILEFVTSISRNAVDFLARDFENEAGRDTVLFKFSVDSQPSTYEGMRMESTISHFALLGCVLSTRLKEKPNRYFLTDSVKFKPFWKYCEALRHFEKKELTAALEHLLKISPSSCSDHLQCRYHNLLGKIYSEMGERQKALKQFTTAIQIDKNFPPAHYYQGREFGKQGIVDSMLKSYQNLVMATKQKDLKTSDVSFEYHLIKILQEPEETSKPLALYVLAVAYGINEMFQDSETTFEKILTRENLSAIINAQKNSFLKIPHSTVVLHEAATMHLMNGNLSRAEEICRLAISLYPNQTSTDHQETDTHGTKDLHWIRNTLQEELKMEIDEPTDTNTYFEDYLSIFDEDVVGTLILAEISEKNGSEEARLLLNQVLLQLSKHIARTQKLANTPENRKQEVLIKALACKTCLYIAKMPTSTKSFAEVDKMFKRALSCNNGDKDVLYFYANYLLESGKQTEAAKLWKTFHNKEPILNAENSQSLALRHLLRTHVSQRLMNGLSMKLNLN